MAGPYSVDNLPYDIREHKFIGLFGNIQFIALFKILFL